MHIIKFQSNLLKPKFLLRIDFKSTKEVYKKMFKTLHENIFLPYDKL
jgi:hypothetical protein